MRQDTASFKRHCQQRLQGDHYYAPELHKADPEMIGVLVKWVMPFTPVLTIPAVADLPQLHHADHTVGRPVDYSLEKMSGTMGTHIIMPRPISHVTT